MSLSINEIGLLEDEYDKANILVLAAEDWAEGYDKDPESHARLIILQTRLERNIRGFLRDMSKQVDSFVDWSAYRQASLMRVQAAAEDLFSVDVIVRDIPIEQSDGTFLKIVFDDMVDLTLTGAQFGEKVYNRYIGLDRMDTVIQQTAKEHVANLIGKKVDKFGNIIDNPNAKYQISDTSRDYIRESIRTSLNLGEDQATATERLREVINNPRRANKIAYTEAVNGFQGGQFKFAELSGAIAKESQSIGASDQCGDYARLGRVPLNYLFGSKHLFPSYHPNCRCNIRFIYPEEK